MIKQFVPVIVLSLGLAAPAIAQTPPSLTDRLETADAPFERGALEALIAVEHLLQSLAAHGIGRGFEQFMGLRFGHMANAAPLPRDAGTFSQIIGRFTGDLDKARATLGQTSAEDATAFVVDIKEIWLDVNGNGTFDPGEEATTILSGIAPRPRGGGDLPEGPVEVRFDQADHAWLMAYTHALAAGSELILSFDPTPVFADLQAAEAGLADLPTIPYSLDAPAIKARIAKLEAELETLEARRQERKAARQTLEEELRELRDTILPPGDGNAAAALDKKVQELEAQLKSPAFQTYPLRQEEGAIRRQIRAAKAKLPPEEMDEETRLSQGMGLLPRDQIKEATNAIYAFLTTLRQEPDPAHLAKLESHLREMLAQNRRFWALVAQETDNDREWIPNGSQTSGLGFDLPEQIATDWQAILSDMEAVLDGRLLIPHPLVPQETGINLAAWFDAPSSLDLVAWIHGRGAYPYLARGPRITAESWTAFQRSTGGNGFGFALFLN